MESRLHFVEVRSDKPRTTFCQAVDEGLSAAQKSLPTFYLYDRRGSELFEEITRLPEYYPTRTEQSILERCACEIVEAVGDDMSLVEFGSGSSLKTRLLLSAALNRQDGMRYVPIDISTEFLKHCSIKLLEEYERLSIHAIGAEYFDAIEALPEHHGPSLMMFLGSNIGNLTHDEATDFLGKIKAKMNPRDRVLIGIDMVKDRGNLESAYNDAQGVTAEFNLNLLHRINRELDADFAVDRFRHSAPYDDDAHRIEMRLYSSTAQSAYVDATGRTYEFEADEFIHTEWSHKYTLGTFGALCKPAGLEIDSHWTDDKGWFSVLLLKPTHVPGPGGATYH